MAGQITRDIIDEGIKQRLNEIATAITPVVDGFKEVATEAERLSKAIGGAENLKQIITLSQKAAKSTEELTFYQSELAKQHQELGKMYAKLEAAESFYNKKIIETKEALKQKNEAIKESITGAKAAAQEAKLNAAASKQNSQALKEYVQSLTAANPELNKLNAYYADLEKQSNKAATAQEKLNQKQANGEFKEYIASLTATNSELKKMSSNYAALERESDKAIAKKEAKERKDAAAALKQQVTAIKLLIAAQQAEKGSVEQLVAVNNILKNKMKQLDVLIPSQRKKYEQLSAAIARNRQRISDLNTQTTTVNGLTGAFKSLTAAAIRFVAVYLGLYQAIALVKNIFNLTKQLDSLDFSMRTIIETQEEYAQTQEFLSKTASNYGQDIVTLTERYIKFRAASKQSNMSAKATQDIFNSTAKAAAVLGLRTDEVNGVFLALEQMISKGKVTTEELRRQLGERLPGAFGIMADALGVSLQQLDKMLKAGEVLSKDALPKFAVALEEAYGIQAVQKVNTLAAAQGRFATEWKETVKVMESSDIFISMIERATNVLYGMKSMIGGINEEFIRGKSESEIYANKLIAVAETAGDQARFDAISEGYDKERVAMEQNKAIIAGLTTAKEKESKVASRRAEELKTHDYEGYLALSNAMNNYKGQLLKQFQIIDESASINKEYIKGILLQANSIEILKNKITELNDVNGISVFNLDGYKNQLSEAEKEYEGFTKIKDETLQRQAEENAAFYANDQQSYRQYLLNQIDDFKDKTAEAEVLYNKEQANIEAIINAGGKATKEQQKQRQDALDNYKNYINASIMLRTKLAELDKGTGKKEKDDSLDRLKQRQKAELEAVKQQQERILQNTDLSDQQRRQGEYDNQQELLQMQLGFLDEQLELVEKGSLDELKIIAQKADLRTQIEENLTKRLTSEYKIRQKELEDFYKGQQDTTTEAIYTTADKSRVAIAKRMTDELNQVKNKQAKQKRIEIKGAVDLLQVEAGAQKQRIDSLNASYINIVNDTELNEETRTKLIADNNKQREDATAKYAQLEEKLNETTRDGTVEVENIKREALQNTLSFIGDSANQAFDILNSIYDAQMDRIESQYQFETSLAGQSQEKKVLAERKYDREKAKLQRKQAIAEKAQAALSIALNTASAIISIWAQVPKFDFGISAGVLTGIVSALGAAQLAVVLGAKIPTFAEGTDSAPARFIAGEEGTEAIIKPDGSVELTPDKATLYDNRSYIGSTILPHDETQRYLANYAVNHTYDMVDMTATNQGIKKLIDVTKSKGETWAEGQYRYVRKGNRTSKYRL